MASSTTYSGDGSSTLFVIPFDYLDRTHVKVSVNGVELATDAYSFPSDGAISLDTAPASGARITIFRETPAEPLTIYQSGSVLSRGDLETDSLQALYRIEEVEYTASRALKVPPESGADGELPALVPGAAVLVDGDGTGFTFGVAGEDAVTDSAANAAAAAASAASAAADAAAAQAAAEQNTALNRAFAKTLPVASLTPPVVFHDHLALSRIYNGIAAVYLQDPYDVIDFTKNPDTPINEYWVDYVNGDDANLGTSAGAGNAWKTLGKANTSAVSPAIIHLVDEWVGYQNSTASAYIWTGNFKIIGDHDNGFVRWVGMRESYTQATFAWADEGGGTWSTSEATTDATIFASVGLAMFDAKYPDEDGGAMPIRDVGSSAECIATPGSQYHDAVNKKKWVHLLDGRKPDPYDGWIYARAQNDCEHWQVSDTGVLLLENIHCYANLGPATAAGVRYRHNTTATNNSRFGAKNCLAYGAGGNGFEIFDAEVIVMSGCGARYNRADNFNYHSFQSTGTKGEYMTVYEYNCKSLYAGYDGFTGQAALGTSCNGSTAHDSMHIERMSCSHGSGNGATVADVNGVVSVNWCVNAGPTIGTGTPKACFWHDDYLGVGTDMGMYLWGCAADDNDDATVVIISNVAQSGGATGQVYVQRWRGQTDGAVTGTLLDWDGAPI